MNIDQFCLICQKNTQQFGETINFSNKNLDNASNTQCPFKQELQLLQVDVGKTDHLLSALVIYQSKIMYLLHINNVDTAICC